MGKKILVFLLPAVYIVPPYIEDVFKSIRSKEIVEIAGNTADYIDNRRITSSSTGSSVHLFVPCVEIPKISCSSRSVSIYASILSAHIVDNRSRASGITNFSLYAYELVDSFRICGYAIGHDARYYVAWCSDISLCGNITRNNPSYLRVEVVQVCK